MDMSRSSLESSSPGWLGLTGMLWLSLVAVGQAQQAPGGGAIGQFLTLTSPVTDQAIGAVRRTALALQAQALREGRKAVLVLEITPGQSQFHHVYALADFLTSPGLSDVRTIAWVPETVTGHNVLLALVCESIVMASDARLGDLGRGEALPAEQWAIVQELVVRGRNRLVTPSLAQALSDPAVVLVQLTIEQADGTRERRLATEEEARTLANSGVAVPESRVLKERGAVGLFSGEQARAGGFLVEQLASSRRELADLLQLPLDSLRETPLPAAAERVSLIEIRGAVDSVLSSFLQRQIGRALESDTQIILFEIHSPGGSLEEVRDLAVAIAGLQAHHVRTVAWVPEMATGEAALLALGCDEIYLTPQAKLGAVVQRREFRLDDSGEQEQAFLLDSLRELAELKGRPPAILLAMADPKLHVFQATNKQTGAVTYLTDEELDQRPDEWLRGPHVPETGRGLLTVSGLRAQQLMVAEPPVESLEEVYHRLGLPPSVKPLRVERTWVDDLVFLLNRRMVTGILFTVALICIYLELHFMTGFLGLTSVVCFALFFWSRFLGGTAGSLEVVLFLLGLGCLALELFVLPGFGLFGVVGGGLVLASLVMASQTFGHVETGRDLSEATDTLKTISGSIITVIVLAVLLSRYLPRIPLFQEMVLTPPGRVEPHDPDEPRLMPEVASPRAALVGAIGTSVTMLRPAGKARFAGRLLDVTSEGPFIPADRPVEIVQASGNHIVVREIGT